MRITRISLYPAKGVVPASDTVAGSAAPADVLLARIETDAELEGWGDAVLWSTSLAELRAGDATRVDDLPSLLLGRDPRMMAAVNDVMDFEMSAQSCVKTALEVACWDILGRSLQMPLYRLLGGMLNECPEAVGLLPSTLDVALDAALERHRAEGISQFSANSGGEIAWDIAYLRLMRERMTEGESLKFDGKAGWQVDEAARIAQAIGDSEVSFEQPCATYEECREVRRKTGVPVLLDESATDVGVVLRATQEGVLDGLNLKLARLGGISKLRVIRDLCVALHIPLEIEDSSVSPLTSAVVVHMGHSTSEPCVRPSVHAGAQTSLAVVNAPELLDGCLVATQAPGLGACPILEHLPAPIVVFD